MAGIAVIITVARHARAFPEHLAKIGLPFDDAYALALQMHNPPQSETQK